MRKYIENPKKTEDYNSESEYIKGEWLTKYFELFCDKCGIKHPDVCVNEFDKEDSFGECALCWNCQKEKSNFHNS